MTSRSSGSMPAARPTDASADVEALLASLNHPRQDVILALRAVIRGVDPRIRESVKWAAPSFATTEHFATFHLRSPAGVHVVLHLGARPRPDAGLRARIDDPTGLLEWRGPDRATIKFVDVADVEARQDAFAAVLRQWIECVV